MRAIFFDRDGTLVKDYPDEGWRNVETLEIFPDTIAALKSIPPTFHLFIVTNQYLIQEGVVNFPRFLRMHKELVKTFSQAGITIEQTFYCPHARSMSCSCRKPNRGMIEQCLVNYDVDLKASFVVGDSVADILLGKRIGAKTIAVRSYFGKAKPTYYARDLIEAASYIQRSFSRDATYPESL